MRILLFLWFFPLVLFWGWYGLSANDINFGYLIFSRQLHDHVFELYANTLNLDRDLLPGMIAGACAFDSVLVLGIAAIRWRASWLPQLRETIRGLWNDEAGEHNAFEIKATASSQALPAE